jgi:hypothetical protein
MTAVIPQARVPYAPDMQVIREITTADVALPTKREAGINCADFDELLVLVTPKPGASALTVEPHFWSEAFDGGVGTNGKFVPESSPQTITMGAAGKMRIVRVGHAKSVWFHCTALTGAGARIEVSGIPVYGQKGG